MTWIFRHQPEVFLALRDLLVPGAHVVDGGVFSGNEAGYLASLVGPRGKVLAVEPVKRRYRKLVANLADVDSDVVVPVNAALTGLDGRVTRIPVASGRAGGGLQGASPELARTAKLDTLANRYGLAPQVVRLELGGAEADGLSGAEEVLERFWPAVMVEETGTDARCHEFLARRGFRGVRLRDHVPILSRGGEEPGDAFVSLYIHPEAHAESSYWHLGERSEDRSDFTLERLDDLRAMLRLGELGDGRYVIHLQHIYGSEVRLARLSVWAGDERVIESYVDFDVLATNRYSIPFHLDNAADVVLRLDALQGAWGLDQELSGARLEYLVAFSEVERSNRRKKAA